MPKHILRQRKRLSFIVFEDIRVLIEFYIWSKNNMNLHDLGEIVGEETIECRNLLKETGMIFKISSVKSLNFLREIKNRVSTRFLYCLFQELTHLG